MHNVNVCKVEKESPSDDQYKLLEFLLDQSLDQIDFFNEIILIEEKKGDRRSRALRKGESSYYSTSFRK